MEVLNSKLYVKWSSGGQWDLTHPVQNMIDLTLTQPYCTAAGNNKNVKILIEGMTHLDLNQP